MSPSVLREPSVFEYAVKEYAREVSMSNADAKEAIEQILEALRTEARAHAAATRPPQIPGWARSILVGIVLWIISASAAGLVAWGSLQSRMTAIENAHPEGISALAVKIDMLAAQQQEMSRRLNEIADKQR